MERIILTLFLALFISNEACAFTPELISSYFRKVPIGEAHIISGQAIDHAFDPDSIKVLVWNIKKTQEADWKKEFLNFGQGRELFLLQEAYPNELFNTTLDTFLDVRWDMGISFRYKKYNNLPTGTMIGSRVFPSELIIKHSSDLEPVTETPKAMTFGKYPVAGHTQELLVVNVHGINFTDLGSFKRNIAQAADEITKHDGPVFIAGDFNTRTKERMKHLFSVMGKLGLKEINFKNGHQRMVAVLTNHILDHGFARGLTIKSAEVLGLSRGSDHKPMVLEVSVK